MTLRLKAIREPDAAERARGAEIVMEWRDTRFRSAPYTHTVLACVCYESWEQWGAPTDVLAANIPTLDRWRTGALEDFPPTE